ncbi:hypothetical protein ACPXCO_23490 [Streptomyces cyaneofuscatus]|uniref:hypothetical protein n=1 Tax=Streptomyces cyaneofuscatus TaxID=66883 RepID=UPI003CF8B436
MPISWDRIPTTTAFMAFERPIAGTPDQPIVAVSWSAWSPGWESHPRARPREETATLGRPVWLHRNPHADSSQRHAYFDGTVTGRDRSGTEGMAGLLGPRPYDWLWVTFYNAFPGNDVPLAWNAEMAIPVGSRLPANGLDHGSRLSWLRVLLAVWDRQTDPEPPPGDVAATVEEREVVRPDYRTKVKKGKKNPLRHTDIIHVVTDRDIPPRRTPAGRREEYQPALPVPRAEPQYGVVIQTKGTQNHCFAPNGEHRRHLGAGEPCPHHRRIPMATEYRKYSDLPLRPNQTVHKPE